MHATRVNSYLKKKYPAAECALRFSNPLELLVATILSAQCTDVRVNKVTPALFKKYRTTADYAKADPTEFMDEIRSTGFYRNKTKNIIATCRTISEEFGGEVPSSMDELLQLPGVARKTANIVLGAAFGVTEGIAVDTHVKRLSRRLGLSKETDPVKIERDLMASLPKRDWTNFSHRLIIHGRQVCHAREPNCPACGMRAFCAHFQSTLDEA